MVNDDDRLPPLRPDWTPELRGGHGQTDAQHEALLAQCHRLADLCEAGSEADFDQAFAQLQLLVRAHFETEAALLAESGGVDPEYLRDEREEFEVLAADIATTAHFDRVELQRFAALWCVGHIAESARR
jgi:hemerythrin